MSFINQFWAADWDGLYRVLASGNPPLALQLLAINTLFLVFFIVRNAASKHRMRSQTVEIIQLILLAANLAVVFHDQVYGVITAAANKLMT